MGTRVLSGNANGSEVAEFFRDQSVWVTGGAGFVGKALVEKLLRTCPGVKTIYVLLRPKKTWDVKGRLENMLDGSLFARIRSERPEVLAKVYPIHGDITTEAVCVNPEDAETLINSVNIILHCAATIKFDLSLKDAVRANVTGTRNVIQFSRRIKNLKSFVHVSTAFSNCYSKDIEEKVYPTNIQPINVVQMTEWMPEDLLQSVGPMLYRDFPNTYCYSKHIGEKLVQDMWRPEMPMCIVRPSIVIATAEEEPVAGWVDNYHHLSGLLIAAGMGIVRIFYSTLYEAPVDVIPLDHVVSLIVAAAWKTGTTPNTSKELKVYNCCSGTDQPFIPARTVPWAYEAFWICPPENVYWYPWQYITQSETVFRVLDKIFHLLPAHIIDYCAKLSGKPPKMVAVYDRMQAQFNSLQFFMNNLWNFSTDNTKSLYASMNPQDKQMFMFNAAALDWKKYMFTYVWGMKKYTLKETEKGHEKARRNLRRLYVVHQVTNLVLVVLLSWLLYLLIQKLF